MLERSWRRAVAAKWEIAGCVLAAVLVSFVLTSVF